MSEILRQLKMGVRKFQAGTYRNNAEAYRKAATEPQRPHTLVVACADSRVDVEAITSSGPGEIFVTRNIGNMIPAYGQMMGAVSAVIEYAVTSLKVKHIVVCGHSDCGAMKALLHPESTAAMPTVGNWLTNGAAALSVATTVQQEDGRDLVTVLTEQNVLMQLAHLKTHPSVAGAMARGVLTISGWIYEIGSGEVLIMDGTSPRFVAITDEA
jgi:carbonic anhydrase